MTQPSSLPANDFSRLKVLILEDQPFQRNVLIGALRHLGITAIETASDGAAALDALEHDPGSFDVAICDLRMEGMDGIEFIRHAVRRKVPSFIVTSAIEGSLLATAEAVVRSFGTRLIGVLPKPVNLERLKGMLSDCKKVKSEEARPARGASKPAFTAEQISRALAANEFIPYFQPKFDLDTGLPTSVEMLARWNHPSQGILPPSAFIPVMEQSGMMDWLSDSLLLQSLRCLEDWTSLGCDISLAVNMSPLTLQNTDMPNHISSLLRKHKVEPRTITIEVTETAVSENVSGLLETLTRLRMQGFSISVDDFGTGYSSLLQLTEMPFNEIKIDRSFVHGATENKKTVAIAESIVQLAKKLDLHTVAEGIETLEELEFIKQLGCESGQGYYLSRPLDNTGLITLLKNVRKR
ncbi:EAL domain-containing response regulator [Noviherbaspirillum galbum]|uniref:EAL domain-containing response regulator n=1 Tax=Noviherbaspirillum galbum TaxID=2709383 RepID=A0A6B3SNY6_9BURK|nr:EAL domain-containing response regulator [Noviherbaspirillum galbum]NEX62580.1 EAL domain-containing response regulator [Noviherbaspirillum galbum]